jgi:hypothetical protein
VKTYEVIFETFSAGFKNTGIEVKPEDAAAIRQAFSEALQARKPVVYGRDWDYVPIEIKDTCLIEADHYSVSKDRIAHFYKSSQVAPVASVPQVIRVREYYSQRSELDKTETREDLPAINPDGTVAGTRIVIRFQDKNDITQKYGVIMPEVTGPEFCVDMRGITGPSDDSPPPCYGA